MALQTEIHSAVTSDFLKQMIILYSFNSMLYKDLLHSRSSRPQFLLLVNTRRFGAQCDSPRNHGGHRSSDLSCRAICDIKLEKRLQMYDGWMTCGFYILCNSISVISGRWKGDNERQFAMKCLFTVGKVAPLAVLEP